jgi:YD repeat-containing protein
LKTAGSSYDGSRLDTVNLMNGNLMLHAPLVPDTPQRGALSLGQILYATSKNWQSVCAPNAAYNFNVTTCSWKSGGTGLHLQSDIGISVHRTLETINNSDVIIFRASGYSLITSDGATHKLAGVAGTEVNGIPTKYDSIDLTGYHLEMSNPDADGVLSTFIVTNRRGTQYRGDGFRTAPCGHPHTNAFPYYGGWEQIIDDTATGAQFCSQTVFADLITDSNGNQMGLANGSVNSDTLGRFQQFSWSGPAFDRLDSTGCGSPHPFNSSWVMYYIAPDGSTQPVKVCWSYLTVQTAFNQMALGYPISEFDSSLNPEGSIGITTLILADGTKWTFDYDNYGELIFIGLPTGGSISYTWSTVNFASCDPTSTTPVSRAVATRTLDDGQGHTQLWRYNWGYGHHCGHDQCGDRSAPQ